MQLKKVLLSITLLLIPYLTNAQELIKGRVLDAETQEGVAFVSIWLKSNKKTTVSNEEGYFQIVVNTPQDTMMFSVLGYQSKFVAYTQLSSPLEILLEPSTYQLPEITVSPEDRAKAILYKAISRVEQNYAQNAYEQKAFYREYLQQDSLCTGFCEMHVDLYNAGFSRHYQKPKYRYLSGHFFRVNAFRRSEYMPKYNEAGVARQIGLDRLLYLKKKLLHNDILNQKNLRKNEFNFTLLEEKQSSSDTLFLIRLSQSGKLIADVSINTPDYAVVKIERYYKTSYPPRLKPDKVTGVRTSFHQASTLMQYRKIKGHYYLDYLQDTYAYLDQGWEENSKPKYIKEVKTLYTEQVSIPEKVLSRAYLEQKYGKIEQFGKIKIAQYDPYENVSYMDKHWANLSPPFFAERLKMYQQLQQVFAKSISQQFEECTPEICSPSEKAAFLKHYNPKHLKYYRSGK